MNLQVLVVEDHKEWREILREEFRNHGCTVASADSLSSAEELLGDQAFDIVTLDMWLTDEEHDRSVGMSSGWRLLLLERLQHRHPDTWVFVVSHAFDSDLERGYEGDPERAFQLSKLGVSDYAPKKNFDAQKIAEWVELVRNHKTPGDDAGGFPVGE